MRHRYVHALLFLLCCSMPLCLAARAADNPYLYKVTLVQAAPGRMLDLIDLYRARAAELKQAGEEAPLWIRES